METQEKVFGVLIHSGEGDYGTIERHTGRPTYKAINRRLAKERCNGDRWARAWIPAGPGCFNEIYYDLDTGELRTIPQNWPRSQKLYSEKLTALGDTAEGTN